MDFLPLKTVLAEIMTEALEFHNSQVKNNNKKVNIGIRFNSKSKEQETLTENC